MYKQASRLEGNLGAAPSRRRTPGDFWRWLGFRLKQTHLAKNLKCQILRDLSVFDKDTKSFHQTVTQYGLSVYGAHADEAQSKVA